MIIIRTAAALIDSLTQGAMTNQSVQLDIAPTVAHEIIEQMLAARAPAQTSTGVFDIDTARTAANDYLGGWRQLRQQLMLAIKHIESLAPDHGIIANRRDAFRQAARTFFSRACAQGSGTPAADDDPGLMMWQANNTEIIEAFIKAWEPK